MAGSALAAGVLVCTTALTVAMSTVGSAAVVAQRAAAAADAAALAAADAVVGAAVGDPCTRAQELAAVHGAMLEACDLQEAVATVRVAVPFGALRSVAEARAGPAPPSG